MRATITAGARGDVTVNAPARLSVMLMGERRKVETTLDWSFPTIEAACAFCGCCQFTWSLVVTPSGDA